MIDATVVQISCSQHPTPESDQQSLRAEGIHVTDLPRSNGAQPNAVVLDAGEFRLMVFYGLWAGAIEDALGAGRLNRRTVDDQDELVGL